MVAVADTVDEGKTFGVAAGGGSLARTAVGASASNDGSTGEY
jgi:hypothetical protein